MIRKGGSRNGLEGTYYGAPMRKWEDGKPVGASANPDGTTTGGTKKRKYKQRYTSRSKSRRRRTYKKRKTQKRKYSKKR
jgi:hypothetical protein